MAGLDAFGTTLGRESDSVPGTYISVADITALSPPGITRNTIDVTSHDSEDGWMEFLGGLKDGGEITFDVNYQPDLHDSLLDDLEAQAKSWRVTFPDGSTWTQNCVLTGFEPDAPYDDKLTASLTLKVSGKPTFDTASS